MQVDLSGTERAVAAGSWRTTMAALYERRTGPRKVVLEPALAPWSRWDPVLPGQRRGSARDRFVRTQSDSGPLPATDGDLAFAPLTQLSRWIEQRKLTSERLTLLYLNRLERFNPKLRCVITLTRELALTQARQADKEISSGKYRGPLHGIPWGAKDLVDTAGIPNYVRRRAIQGSRAYAGRCCNDASARSGRGARGEAEHGCARAERYLVRWPDDEPVAAGGRLVGIKCRPRRSYGGGIGGFRHRERDGWKHHRPVHALRNYRAAAHLRPCAAHRRDDALLVARQARPHDAQRRRRPVGAASHFRSRRRRRVQRIQQIGFRYRRNRGGVAGGEAVRDSYHGSLERFKS